mmetsp:Transcript_62604/g.183085  ORF Transcript_62604/g.183085 Transcript_62604/m.183085 type:complete len:201 (+) Transcript_62604:321-923(+)
MNVHRASSQGRTERPCQAVDEKSLNEAHPVDVQPQTACVHEMLEHDALVQAVTEEYAGEDDGVPAEQHRRLEPHAPPWVPSIKPLRGDSEETAAARQGHKQQEQHPPDRPQSVAQMVVQHLHWDAGQEGQPHGCSDPPRRPVEFRLQRHGGAHLHAGDHHAPHHGEGQAKPDYGLVLLIGFCIRVAYAVGAIVFDARIVE